MGTVVGACHPHKGLEIGMVVAYLRGRESLIWLLIFNE